MSWRSGIEPASPPVPTAFSMNGSEVLNDRWWEQWNSAELNALVEEALSENFSLSAAWARLEQAEASLSKADAGRFPTLGASGNARRDRSIGEDRDTIENDSGSVGLSASWEIDLWGRIRSSSNAARLDRDASKEDLQATAISLVSQIVQTWLQLGEQHGQRVLLREQISLSESTLELIQARFARGQSSASDLWQQERLVESRKGNLILVEARIKSLEYALAVLIGKDPASTRFPAITSIPVPPPFPSTGTPAEALGRRPDIRAAWMRVEAADHRIASAMADRFPRISLSAGLSSPSSETLNLFNEWITSVAGSLGIPLIDGGSRRAEVDRNEALLRQLLSQYGNTWLTAIREVEDAILEEKTQRAYLSSIDTQIGLAERVLTQTSSRYEQGQLSYLQVLEAQQTLQGLQRSRLETARAAAAARVDLHKAIGGGFELPANRAVESILKTSEY